MTNLRLYLLKFELGTQKILHTIFYFCFLKFSIFCQAPKSMGNDVSFMAWLDRIFLP